MGIKKQFLLLMITIMPVAYVSGIVIFDIAAECISENSDLKKDQVQSEEKNYMKKCKLMKVLLLLYKLIMRKKLHIIFHVNFKKQKDTYQQKNKMDFIGSMGMN